MKLYVHKLYLFHLYFTFNFNYFQWQEQHMDITCEKFAQWKKDNDPNTQLTGVMKYLENNGIQCPNCEVKYSLTK